jgi:PAS domain S-box-containing protein
MGIIASAIGNEDKRKQVEDELQENADKYKSLFENSVLAILMGEPDGKILNANRIATELFGYSLEELRQVGRKGILDETDEHTIESLKHRKANGTITGTLKFIKKDGSTFSGQLYSAIYRDKNGREKTSIIIQDVSDKLKTEKLLKDSEELYRTLVENMPDGVYKTTHEGRFIEVNPAMAKMFGYSSKEELMAVNIPETMYFSPDDREKLMMKELGGELLEYCVRKKDGSPIWVEDHGWYTRDDSGNIISHEGILRDISQKRKTLLALKESEEKYRTFISSTSDMVYLKDENHRYTIVNQAFADYFNCQPTDIIGKTDFEIMPAIAAENCLETDRIALGANTVYMSEETIGNEVFETSKFKVLLASGNYGTGGYIRNITVRKRNEKQLAEQADKLMQLNATKDKLFSVIAHDLRNPFNIILGFTDLLTENYNDFDETAIQNSIKAITIASHQAYNLLENLLLWAKAQSDRIEFTQDVVDINACIRETMVLCYNQAEAKHIDIFTDIDNKCFALADYNLTSIIVRNLITNALKFTNQKGKVWITAHNRSDSVEIAVNDNGIGMDPEVINNIIIKGNTISTTGTSNEKGSGLGLLICKEFIEKQGGRLDIKSKPGAGSTFSFTLPLP